MIRLLIFVVSFGVYLQVVWAEGLPFNDHNEHSIVHCYTEQGVRGVVSNTLQSCTGDNASWQNFARTWAANTIGQWGSSEIGDLVNISPAAKTFFHGFVGGTSGGLMGGTGCVAAGIAGGIVGETLCHKMIQSGVSADEAAKIARIMSTIAGIPIGGNPVVAHATATNTVTHNCLAHLDEDAEDDGELIDFLQNRHGLLNRTIDGRLTPISAYYVEVERNIKAQERFKQEAHGRGDLLGMRGAQEDLEGLYNDRLSLQSSMRDRQSYRNAAAGDGAAYLDLAAMGSGFIPGQGGTFLSTGFSMAGSTLAYHRGEITAEEYRLQLGLSAVGGGRVNPHNLQRLSHTANRPAPTGTAVPQAADEARTTAPVGEAQTINQQPYHPRTMEAHLRAGLAEGETMTSSTLPRTNERMVHMAGKRHPVTGTVYCQRGYPIFDDVAVFDTIIAKEIAISGTARHHKSQATRALAHYLQNNPSNLSCFDRLQLDSIMQNRAQIPGYIWHHHQNLGRMQLIPENLHVGTGHIGGDAMWKRVTQ